MNQLIFHLGPVPIIVAVLWPSYAQSETNLDDVTMTVINDGALKAPRLERPNEEAIRQFTKNNSSFRPSEVKRPVMLKGVKNSEREELRALIEPGDAAPLEEAR